MVQSRARWVTIGKALAEGRMLLPGPVNNRRYGEWVKACGFNNIGVATRSDAIWWATISTRLVDIPVELNNPQWIRKWNRDQQVAKPPRPDLDLSEAKVTLNPVDVLGIASMSRVTLDTPACPMSTVTVDLPACRRSSLTSRRHEPPTVDSPAAPGPPSSQPLRYG